MVRANPIVCLASEVGFSDTMLTHLLNVFEGKKLKENISISFLKHSCRE